MPSAIQLIISSCITSTILLLLHPTPTTSHGFLSTPRSRNLVAYEDRLYHGETTTTPFPEDCPTCINRGGTLARCGVLKPGSGDERNYDFPKNAFGDAMPANPQDTYEEEQIIDMEVVLSAHHKGHFVFKACPIPFTTISPTQECFDEHPLLFVADELYGAPVDADHPERVYIAPETIESKVTSSKPGFDRAMLFQFKMKLPQGVTGDLVLIQWYYVAGNSGCVHDGYNEYAWPENWIHNMDEDEENSVWESKVSVGMGLKSCEEGGVIPPDGEGTPEQFWNCAEVSIVPQSESSTLPSQNTGQLQSDKTIIGYWASWQWYDRNIFAQPWVFDYRKYTRVNFAFFQTNENGDLWGTDSWADPIVLFGSYNWNGIDGVDPEYCSWDLPDKKVCQHHFYEKGLLHLVKAAGAEIWPSIGGWSLSDPFPVMAKNAGARANFAQKCVELIEEYGFDGIDIDWEYPGYEAHSGTPDDTETYNLLLRDVRQKLDELGDQTGKFYGLTAALPCGTIMNMIDIPTAAKYLSELNLMTYDFFGAWSPTTGVNAPLFDQNWGDTVRYSVDGCVKNWVEAGGSPSNINIGLPFYGRGFMKAKHLNETHMGKPDKTLWGLDEGSPQYFNIVNKLPELVSVRHEMTATQYAYNNATVNGIEVGGMVSYDDEEAICDKTEYCLEHQLNGFIIWEMSGDLMDDYSTPLIDAVHAKLNDPSLDCKKFAYDPGTFSGYATPLGNEVGASLALVKSAGDEPTPAPVKAMTCPSAWFWGVLQWDECKSYYHCTNGKPDVATLEHCPEGELFDEISHGCQEASTVTCSETENPTPSPVSASGYRYHPECPAGFSNFKAGPDCTSYYRCNDGVLVSPIIPCQTGTLFDESLSVCNFEDSVRCTATISPTPISTSQPTRYPTQSIVETQNKPLIIPQTTRPTRNPTPKPSRQPATNTPSHEPTASGYQYNPECPASFSDFKAGPDCTSYYRCNDGVLVSPIIPCQTGRLFDESISACNFEDSVRCTATISPTPISTPQPTRYPTQSIVETQNKPLIIPQTTRPTRNPTPKPSRQPATNAPSHKPTAVMMFNSPTSPSYEIIQTESNTMLIVAKPTNRPTKKPKRRKTPKPSSRPTPRNPVTGGNTMASSFLSRPSSSFTITPPSESIANAGEHQSTPVKGEGQIGLNIKNQIQQQIVTKKGKMKVKKGKRGKKKDKDRKSSKSRKTTKPRKSSKSKKEKKKKKKKKNNKTPTTEKLQ